MRRIDGEAWDLSRLRGRVVLFVNVASRCGFTPQYAGLQELHRRYAGRGLVVVGVPANDFGRQEPGSNTEIAAFCRERFGVSFPMLAKVHVRGPEICPLYAALTSPETTPGDPGPVKWNFEKFLVDREGRVAARFRSPVAPDDETLVAAIEKTLG
jgi:glutathione peroxidase